MKKRVLLLACTMMLSLSACGDDDDDFGPNLKKDFEELEESSSSYDDSEESSSSKKTSSSSEAEKDADKSSSSVSSSSQNGSDEPESSSSFKAIADPNSGKDYRTVKIGGFTWLTENLRADTNSYCYDGKEDNCMLYGGLYQTDKATCPTGFRPATYEAWISLFGFAKTTAAIRTKKVWAGGGISGTDALGFSLLPAGSCGADKKCSGISTEARYYVTAGGKKGYFTIAYDLASPKFTEEKTVDTKGFYSVRCAKADSTVAEVKDIPKTCSSDQGSLLVEKTGQAYLCAGNEWTVIRDTVQKTCLSNQELQKFIYGDKIYICKSDSIREFTDMEQKLNRICSKANRGDTVWYDDKVYYCDSLMKWIVPTANQLGGECTAAKELDSIRVDKSTVYVCLNSKWIKPVRNDSLFGFCTAARTGELATADSIYTYVCKNYQWSTATKNDVLGSCTKSNAGTISTYNGTKYICKDSTWSTANTYEAHFGFCTADKENTFALDTTFSFSPYVCRNGSWKTANKDEYLGTCGSTNQGETKVYVHTTYVCDSDWRTFSSVETKFGLCTDAIQDSIAKLTLFDSRDSVHSNYVCQDRKWTILTHGHVYGTCTSEMQDLIVLGANSTKYVCDENAWRTYKTNESNYGICTKNYVNRSAYTSAYSSNYMCNGSAWVYVDKVTSYIGKVCTNANYGETAVYNDTIYSCNESYKAWRTTYVNATLGKCPSDSVEMYDIKRYKGIDYRCMYSRWEEPKGHDKELGYCVPEKHGTLATSNDTLLICITYTWEKAILNYYLEGCTSAKQGTSKTYYGQKFTCNNGNWDVVYGSFTDPRDGQVYKTVVLDSVTVMAENLNYSMENSWCYNNQDSNCDQYGRLYSWDAAQNACPTGWHLPDVYEFNEFLQTQRFGYTFVDGSTWQGLDDRTSNVGFNLKGSGFRRANGGFDYEHRVAGFWYSNDSETGDDGYIYCVNDYASASSECTQSMLHYFEKEPTGVIGISTSAFAYPKGSGFSVRCLKD